jgi:hypothetical protein
MQAWVGYLLYVLALSGLSGRWQTVLLGFVRFTRDLPTRTDRHGPGETWVRIVVKIVKSWWAELRFHRSTSWIDKSLQRAKQHEMRRPWLAAVIFDTKIDRNPPADQESMVALQTKYPKKVPFAGKGWTHLPLKTPLTTYRHSMISPTWWLVQDFPTYQQYSQS